MSITGAVGRVRPAQPGDPARIGPYRIIGRLGSGGMGTVHAGLTADGLRVAVKVIHPAQAQDPEFRARFRREVQLSARVQGPCLVPLLAADPEAGAPWLATAYAPGPTLDRHIARYGPLTGGTLYAFATGTAQALAAIHAAGVVHRDVKPQNVILSPAGPRVLDFGIAHAADGTSVTRTGVLTGTPGWISPEHYRSGVAGPAGDMFAWGALIAYAATGRLPFGTGAPDVVAYRVMSGEADLAGTPAELRDIVADALAKEPGARTTAPVTADRCARLLATQATQIGPAPAAPPDPRVTPAPAGPHPPTAASAPPATPDPRVRPAPPAPSNPYGPPVRPPADPLVALWQIPAVDDPRWTTTARSSSRGRTAAVVLGAAAVVGALVGAAVAFPGAWRDPADAAGSNASASAATHREAAATSPAPTGSARTAGPAFSGTGRGAIPADPLAGAPNPAFTRSGDDTEPSSDDWRDSAVAATADETEVAGAVRAAVRTMLATKDLAFMEPQVTFDRRAQTVVLTGGPVSQLPEAQRTLFRRSAGMAACATLAHRLADAPDSWAYGRYAVFWKDSDTATDATALGFGEATDGCYHTVAGQWQGEDEGIAAARMPSADKTEFQVADGIDKAVTRAWRARVARDDGIAPEAADEDISLGFDPVQKAAYLWIVDTRDAVAGRAQRDNFQDLVTRTACPRLLARYKADKSWPYTRWSVVVYSGGLGGTPEIVRSGDCLG
ncbi:protein kinase [Streptomyces sp. J2-1]|uniref:serine/threonine-protein kinase n=1 Tax=Streptomyces corallincola TaxID=2851888 RepID=UPI001C382B67|nr:serine/threonine-protein kinase [Streptomyces corallincola]MBV2357950.1 protein kinase [Streptomyces corallincola]